jgi:hypothetical protein
MPDKQRPRLRPAGNALTESVPLTDRDGVQWLVYIEGLPLRPQLEWPRRTRMPGRALRFDCDVDSRRTAVVPAGAPFLQRDRLEELLDYARPLPR